MAKLFVQPERLGELENAINETGTRAATVINKIRESYLSVVGPSWSGGAANAAVRKQQEFGEIWKRLEGILTELHNAVGGTKKLMMQTDADDELRLAAVDPTASAVSEGYGSQGSGMAGKFASRT